MTKEQFWRIIEDVNAVSQNHDQETVWTRIVENLSHYPLEDINPMTVKIPMNDHLKGYKYYQAVYLGDPLERFDAVVEGDFLVFETTHLSQYAILGSNTPFSTSTVQDGEQTGAGDQSSDTTIPQTGDSSNLALWIGLMLASCGVLGMLFYRRKKAAAGK